MFGQDDATQPAQAPILDNGALQAAMPDQLAVSTNPVPTGITLPEPSADPTAPATAADSSAPELPAQNFGLAQPTVPIATPEPTTTPSFPAFPQPQATTTTGDDLASIKQQALEQLSPLVGHLEQTPEEKFRTTMMMIQASDNRDLVKDAFDAAQKITDDKARAQALLDVINEINYFSQQQATTNSL